MRKLIIAALAIATALPTFASAQTGELRHDRQEVRQQQRQLNRAQMHGDRHDVREQRQDVREARRETREDWRDYRNGHQADYRRPAYVGPRGYAYRPVAVGHRFAPAYYGQRYWVNDWQRYRLPSPGYNRYVRYGNDVVLVNPRSGFVVQVFNGFFL